MNRFWNWETVRDEATQSEKRVLHLEGVIASEAWWNDEVSPRVFKEELEAGSGPIDVWINSPGGDVFAGAQIYNMLMDYPHDVIVKIDGIAASAASVIAMAGTTVCMSPVGMMMIHNPSTSAWGDSAEMKKAIKMLDEVKESIINAYEIKTYLTRDQISRLMDAESWFNAKKALELGFADKILFDGEPVDANSVSVQNSFIYAKNDFDASVLKKLIPPKEEKRVPVESLEKRLDLIKPF